MAGGVTTARREGIDSPMLRGACLSDHGLWLRKRPERLRDKGRGQVVDSCHDGWLGLAGEPGRAVLWALSTAPAVGPEGSKFIVSVYAHGATTPTSIDESTKPVINAKLLARTSVTAGVIATQSLTSHFGWSMTSYSSVTRTLRRVVDPCGSRVAPVSLAIYRRSWTLLCSDGSGVNELWRSSDVGGNWTLVTKGTQDPPSRSEIGSLGTRSLTISDNGRVLWLAYWSQGIKTSTDGGRRWRLTLAPNDGYTSGFAAYRTTAAMIAVPSVGIYRTLNGVGWTLVR